MLRLPGTALIIFATLGLRASADPARAEQLREEARQCERAGDPDGAIRKMGEAIDEAPEDPDMRMSRAWFRSRGGDKAGAILDAGDCIRLWKKNPGYSAERVAHDHLDRAAFFCFQDRYADSLPDCDEAIRLVPGKKWPLSGRGVALIGLGDHDAGVALLQEAATEEASAHGQLAPAAFLRCDWAAVLSHAEAVDDDSTRDLWNSIAWAEQGRFEEAWNAAREARRLRPGNSLGFLAHAWVEGTPGHARTNIENSITIWKMILTYPVSSQYIAGYARTLFLLGRYGECRDVLTTRGSERSFHVRFWLGAAQWKLDQAAEARENFRQARRLNPYAKAWAAKVPGLAEFFATVDAEVASEAGAKGGTLAIAKEGATWLMSAAEVETIVRRYQFARAVTEYGKLLPATVSPVRRKGIETRVAEIKLMAAALDKLVAAVNRKPGTLKTRVAGQELALVKADANSFEFTIARGTGKFPWAYLELAEFLKFAADQTLTPEERFGIAVLQWDLGETRTAQEALIALLKASPSLKDKVSRVVARKRGLPEPATGFVPYKGRFVTGEEKENFEKGLVRYNGDWIPAADRDSLAKGLVKAGDKWVPAEEKKLLDAGFRKQGGKWVTGEEDDALTSDWANAIVHETAHYTIRSNAGRAFVGELALVVELAYGELKAFYNGREPKLPGSEKMTLYAYRTYEDYRRYCVEKKAESSLNAAGFAASDTNIVVGWNKTGDQKLFLQTMVHEAAHLYFYRTSTMTRWPSWFMEGMATYFEGFQGSTGAWRFSYNNDSRVALAKQALGGTGFIPLKDLLGGDAGALINSDASKALVFYSECWALNYFLTRTSDKALANAYKDFRDAMAAGKNEEFTKYFPDLDGLEKAWKEFGAGM
ncbi:MAG: tetratricopeptide repeat protein [Planctomycetota bacterium]